MGRKIEQSGLTVLQAVKKAQ